MQAMNEIETFPFTVFQSLIMPTSPPKDFGASWKMEKSIYFSIFELLHPVRPTKIITFAEIWCVSQNYPKQLSHKISANSGTHKWGNGPKMTILAGYLSPFLVFLTLSPEVQFVLFWIYFFRILRQKLHTRTTYPMIFGYFYYFWYPMRTLYID